VTAKCGPSELPPVARPPSLNFTTGQRTNTLQCYDCPSDQAKCGGRSLDQVHPLPGQWRVPWASLPHLAFATCVNPS